MISDSQVRQEIKLRGVISRIHNLPTPAVVLNQINKVINNPNTSAYDVAAIISEDPAISAKVLKLTNSAFYGIPRTVINIKQAIIILGLEAVKSLILSASVFDMFARNQIEKEYQEQFWRHSLACAFAARIIARSFKTKTLLEGEISFSAGLLHDVGKLVICGFMPEEHKSVKALMEKEKLQNHEAEEKVFGFNHAHVGGVLAESWHLPENLHNAIVFHHNPKDSKTNKEQNYIIHFANYLSKLLDKSESEWGSVPPPEEDSWLILGISRELLPTFLTHLQDEYSKAEIFIKMAKGEE